MSVLKTRLRKGDTVEVLSGEDKGTKGDIVFNANPGPDRVFAWICTGSYNWQVIKGAE